MYILKSEKTDSYYIGSSQDLDNRVEEHNSGKSVSTRGKRPWKLVYSESYKTLSGARKREMEVKSWKIRKMIDYLIQK
ncbi:MAG: GIY-YIG nuclease family protein [Bacteroidetes bacterium]|nr:GIY-YIG nuclease family protein [Bacteroidota bacterium]